MAEIIDFKAKKQIELFKELSPANEYKVLAFIAQLLKDQNKNGYEYLLSLFNEKDRDFIYWYVNQRLEEQKTRGNNITIYDYGTGRTTTRLAKGLT